MKNLLLDTNAYSKLLVGEESILTVLARATNIHMSVFVLGELFDGFKGGPHEAKNREVLFSFLEKPGVKIVAATLETAQIFGEVKQNLKTAGTPIPINDVWIASHVLETGSVLLSFDKRFKHVPGLRLWQP